MSNNKVFEPFKGAYTGITKFILKNGLIAHYVDFKRCMDEYYYYCVSGGVTMEYNAKGECISGCDYHRRQQYDIEAEWSDEKPIEDENGVIAQVSDPVEHPTHYTSHPSGIECIEITRHYCFAIGNAIKYLWRAGLKQDADKSSKEKEIEDLRKAVWYINDRIKQLENE